MWSAPHGTPHIGVEHAKRREITDVNHNGGQLSEPPKMEVVRLEFVGAVALSSAAVAQFVQALRDVPQGAVCEIEEIRCRRLRESGRHAETSTESVVRLHCDPPVAAFLCKRFA